MDDKSLEYWKQKIKNYKEEDYKYDPHFSIRLVGRCLSLEEVIAQLKNPDKLIKIEKYKDKGFRLFFKISSRFILVIGVEFHSKALYIKTVFRRYRKWTLKRPRIRG